ncbi:MAG: hypothetical protein D6757_08950 [Alphaproteobacteria bacterium]|nr:MAG: hypothetical protein D6757_08950 [Alphaproteobacteria bacterium]
MRAAPAERGYYRYLPDRQMRDDLWRHLDILAADEAISLTDHLVSAMIAGRMSARELLARLEALAASPHWPALVPQIDHLHRWRVLLPPDSATAHALSGFLRRLYGLALSRARRPDRNPVYPAAFRREARYRLAAAWIVDGGIDAPDARIVELLDPGTEKPELAAHGRWEGGEIPSFAWTLDLAALRRDPARALPPIAERLRRDASPDVRRGALMALAHSGLEPAVDALKAYALSPEADGRDVVMILELLSRDPARARDHWRWVNEWHGRLAERLNVFTRPALIRVAAGLCDRTAADRLAATVSRWGEQLAGRSVVVHQTASRIRACAAERKMLMSALARAFGNDRTSVRPGGAGDR